MLNFIFQNSQICPLNTIMRPRSKIWPNLRFFSGSDPPNGYISSSYDHWGGNQSKKKYQKIWPCNNTVVWPIFFFITYNTEHKFKKFSGCLALNVKLVSCWMINVVIWKLEFSLIIVSWEAETSIHQCPAWIPGPSVWQWSITSHSHHISWNAAASNIYQHQTHHPHQPAAQTANRRYLDHIK